MSREGPRKENDSILCNQTRVLDILRCFSSHPPNVLLLEGGTLEEREKTALYWSALLNCKYATSSPCQNCTVCSHIFSGTFRDQYLFYGREGTIKIEDVREIRNVMGQMPEHGGHRVFIINQAQELTPSAANALLKSMEEPAPRNVFVLTAPEQSRILSTLVSRSWVLTLNWSDSGFTDIQDVQVWIERLLNFWKTGQGLFEYTAQKNELDSDLVRKIIGVCQKSLVQLMTGEVNNSVSRYWNRSFSGNHWGNLENLFRKSLQALDYQVNPSMVLDWLALQIRVWCE